MDVAVGSHLSSDDRGLGGDVPLIAALEPFDDFYRREYRSVVGIAAVLCGDRSTAEDLAQDAFAVTMRDWDRVGRMDNPEAFVRRVVANKSVSRFRRSLVEIRAIAGSSRSETSVDGLNAEISIDTWREVRRLPKRQAQVVVLTYLADLSRREVAGTLGCSEETVKTHLDRARQRLASQLSEYGGGT